MSDSNADDINSLREKIDALTKTNVTLDKLCDERAKEISRLETQIEDLEDSKCDGECGRYNVFDDDTYFSAVMSDLRGGRFEDGLYGLERLLPDCFHAFGFAEQIMKAFRK